MHLEEGRRKGNYEIWERGDWWQRTLQPGIANHDKKFELLGKEMGKCFKQSSDMIRLVFRMIIWLLCRKRRRKGRTGKQSVNRRFTLGQRELMRKFPSRSQEKAQGIHTTNVMSKKNVLELCMLLASLPHSMPLSVYIVTPHTICSPLTLSGLKTIWLNHSLGSPLSPIL